MASLSVVPRFKFHDLWAGYDINRYSLNYIELCILRPRMIEIFQRRTPRSILPHTHRAPWKSLWSVSMKEKQAESPCGDVKCIYTPDFTSIFLGKNNRSTTLSAYEALLDHLLHLDKFETQQYYYTTHNSKLHQVLSAFTFSRFFCKESADRRTSLIEKRRFAFELMIGWMVRIYNQFALVFPVILLSLMALKSDRFQAWECW